MRESGRCRPVCHKPRWACLQAMMRTTFRRESRAGSRLREDSSCTFARWPSSKVPSRGSKRLRFKLSQERPLERVFERRVDHVGAVFEHSGDESDKARLGIILMNEAVGRRRLNRLDDLADLVDVDLV